MKSLMKNIRRVLLCMFLTGLSGVFAADVYWRPPNTSRNNWSANTSATYDFWSDVSGGTVVAGLRPGSQDNVQFLTTTSVVRLMGNIEVASITQNANRDLTLELDTWSSQAGITDTHVLASISGNVNLGVNANSIIKVTISGANQTRNVTTSMFVGGQFTLANRSNKGLSTLTVETGGNLTVGAGLVLMTANNAGGQATLIASGGSIYVGGNLQNSSADGIALLDWTAGTIAMVGSNLAVNNAGTGVLRVSGDTTRGLQVFGSGNYMQAATAQMHLRVSGTGQTISMGGGSFEGDYDYVFVRSDGQSAVIAGTVYLDISNYILQEGDKINIAYASVMTVDNGLLVRGNWDTSAGYFSWDVVDSVVDSKDFKALQLTYHLIPEPAASAGLLGLLALVLVARRR